MPRDGTGTYSLPSGNPVQTNTPISSTVQNNTMADVAAALSQSLSKDGQATPTANLPMAGYKHTGAVAATASGDYLIYDQLYGASVTLASAATTSIGATTSNNVVISGTTNITSLGSTAEGLLRFVTFSGSLTLSYNATSLILPGSADIVTQAGDSAIFKSLGAGNWKCLAYQRATGTPVANDPNPTNIVSVNGGPLAGTKNRIINGSFAINQRGVSGIVTLAAGAYGHDRWKAGASGCTYSFSVPGPYTVITITSGSLIQVIEGANVDAGVYTLSNKGTSQARIAVNGAALGGGASATPLVSAAAQGGQNISVEFLAGTIDRVQLEIGSTASTFEHRSYGLELALCQRYYEVVTFGHVLPAVSTGQGALRVLTPYKATKRATPTGMALTAGFLNGFSTPTINAASADYVTIQASVNATVLSGEINGIVTIPAEL